MGYFPLPELKGKPNRIFVDGKTLNQIAKESGIRLDTVQHRYSRGIRDYEGLTKPSHIRVEHEKAQRKTYSIMSAGERVMERIWELDIPLQTISDKTGISRSTIYAFLYNGTDLSSMRLATLKDGKEQKMQGFNGVQEFYYNDLEELEHLRKQVYEAGMA